MEKVQSLTYFEAAVRPSSDTARDPHAHMDIIILFLE